MHRIMHNVRRSLGYCINPVLTKKGGIIEIIAYTSAKDYFTTLKNMSFHNLQLLLLYRQEQQTYLNLT